MEKTWSYGVTTVPERDELLSETVLPLIRKAGFDEPRIFRDGLQPLILTNRPTYEMDYVVNYHHSISAFGNWLLGLWELFIRNPKADFYAMFQDDIKCSVGIKEYIEATVEEVSNPTKEKYYLNLHTHRNNAKHAEEGNIKGWFPASQKGKGALALVFPHNALPDLFSSRIITNHLTSGRNNWKNIDGVVYNTLTKQGYTEYCHSPGLVQHIGEESILKVRSEELGRGHPTQPPTDSFLGTEANCMDLI